MASKIKLKRSSIPGNKPTTTQLDSGELAINTADGKVFLLRDDNTVQDITQRIFQNDSEILISDEGDSSAAVVSMKVNNEEQLTVTDVGFDFKNDIDINNAKKLTFRELTASGDDGISIKAPDTLAGGYDLTLPNIDGTVGQLLRTKGAGQLEFVNADFFGGNVVYVSAENGDDTNDGLNAPVKTVKKACQLASGLVYNADGSLTNRRINIKVAVGDYTEQNPIIVPDNTVIKGDGLRGCIIRPANANQDMLRVRNACYFGEFTFRDGVDANFVPTITFDYAVSFDDPFDTSVSRVGYTNLPDSRPTITTSPYIQNCSILSFLGGNGAKIDGSKVGTPNVPLNKIEAENPVVGATPEQGKSMVANAFTMLSFGGTGWRLLNDAYAQIVSCFQIFMLNGVYCQSGGYCSVTNSATNFGLYALRSSGYSPKAFQFDRALVVETGQSEGQQTLKVIGVGRDQPVEEYVIRFREADYKIAYDLIQMEKATIADDTITWINDQIAAATPSIWAGFTYNQDKCARDTKILVDAVKYDVMFNSNFRSISAAKSYYGANAAEVINNQLDQTVAALTEAKDYTNDILVDATAISRSDALWDEIIDIVSNGTGAADAYSLPDPTGYNTSYLIGYGDARAQLIANRSFIIEEITQWIAEQVATSTAPFTDTFSYDVAKCERDVGLILDALRYDLTYGGNLETYRAALSYITGALPAGEVAATVAAYTRLKDILGDIAVETLITKTSTNALTQDVTGTAGSAESATFIEARIQEIIDYIEDTTVPSIVEPSLSWISQTLQDEGSRLSTVGQDNIAQRVIEYINSNIQANMWYGFTYNQSFCLRDTLLILDAVAKDTWSTGNTNCRGAGLSYYNQNIQDSTASQISGQEMQTVAAINQVKSLTNTFLAGQNGVNASARSFVDSRFDIITAIINDPDDLPNPEDVTGNGEITNSYKANPTTVSFDAATQINASTNVITIVGHGFANGQQLTYDANGNTEIGGLNDGQQYYVKLINTDEFTLDFDDSLTFPVDILSASTGTQNFITNVKEFFVDETIDTHQIYQTLILESGAESYEFTPGKAITGATGAANNSAYVYSWEPNERRLVVSVEQVLAGSSLVRPTFESGSTISEDHAGTPNTNITVNEATAKTGLGTATFTILSTSAGEELTNLVNLLTVQIWFHRPSIVNSSAHTWEYAGSGTDYNALPQNGGNTREAYEQYEELPGRVYSSGTNELGDFKVGDFITAFNRTGNITFRNKVQVDELDALKLSLSNVAIEEISTDVNLGDNEVGGASNNRLSTQLAVRSFLSNRLGGFIDKTVSTAAVPGAIVQLNTNGQLNTDLIPATRAFRSTNSEGYLSRLNQVYDIPAVDLSAGDIATEEYEQQELTLSGNITAADGDVISQPGIQDAIGYAKGDYNNSGTMLVASQEAGWDDNADSTGSGWQLNDAGHTLYVNGVDSGVYPVSGNVSSNIIENFFLKSSNTSQFIVLDPDTTPTVTIATITTVERTSNISTITTSGAHGLYVGNNIQVICDNTEYSENGRVLSVPSSTTFTIANEGINETSNAQGGSVRTIVTSSDSSAQGAVTQLDIGVLGNVDNANIVSGTLYTPVASTVVYENVSLTSTTGVGTGAKADITVTAGSVTDVDVRRGGSGYEIGDTLSANSADIGGTGSGFSIEVLAIEDRLWVNILGGELFVASASSIDYFEDNLAVQNARTITLDGLISHNFLAGTLAGGGNVDYTNSRITITAHGLTNGDPVKYNTLGNTAIGGLLNDRVYYTKVVDDNTIEIYDDYSLITQMTFLTTPANNNHNLSRYQIGVVDNSVIVEGHGYSTGDAIRVESGDDGSSTLALPSVSGTEIAAGSRFFVGSVTTNSFTLHSLRSDALASINGLVTNAKDIDAVGAGDMIIYPQNIRGTSVVNTSSRIKANWNSLAVTNIDASNIISGTISPSRLGSSGVASTDTFLRGDSAYAVAVQHLIKANTTDNPITLTGPNVSQQFYGDVSVGIANVDNDPGAAYSTLGTSRFLQSQFDVATDASGQVFIKDGVVDAGTLDTFDSTYFLNPSNLTSNVPVTRGGTGLDTYEIGDIIYASSTGTLNTLNVGVENTVLTSTGSAPAWTTSIDVAEGVGITNALLSTSSVGNGKIFNDTLTSVEVAGDANTVRVGSAGATRNITSYVTSFEAAITKDVVINLTGFTTTNSAAVANGVNIVPISNTSSIVVGMLITGTSIPANTTVTGKSTNYVYLSANTTGTITSGTTLTFTNTPEVLGVRAGDTINISNSVVTNLDGTWPVSGATPTATSITIRTESNVTADPNDALAGGLSVTKDASMVIRTPKVVLGTAEASSSPADAKIIGESGIGTNKSGGEVTIEAGRGTGNATGGDVVIKTSTIGSSGDVQQVSAERVRIDTSGKASFKGEVEVNNNISTTEATVALLNDTATTINAFGSATNIDIGAATGTMSINNASVDLDGDLNVDGGDITTNATSFNIVNANATSVNIAGAGTTVSIGASTGTTTVNNKLVVGGDLEVQGATTTLNTATLAVEDKNIEIAKVTSPTDTTADGAGITIKGATDKTITWNNNVGYFNVNQSWNLTSGLAYYINDTSVLNSTTLGAGVVNSSLTTVGTIGTGVWQGTTISPTYGGTGINNGSKTITLGGNFTHTGAHTLGLTTTGNTSITLPTSGTLAITGNGLNQFAATTSAQLAGVISDETGSGALVFATSPSFTTGINAASTTMALFDTTATTINMGGAATTVDIGAATGTTTVHNNVDIDLDLNVDGGDITTNATTFNLINTNATTVNFAKAATTLDIGATTGTTSINNSLDVDGDLNVDGGDITTNATTFNLINTNATTVNAFGAASTISIGAATSETTFNDNVTISGNLTVSAGGSLTVDSINNTPIGNTTPSTGAFTTLTASGLTTVTNATSSTSKTTGALVVTGGVGVSGSVYGNSFHGSIAASNIDSGTFDNARIASSNVTQHQADITGTGALNSGSITTGFGNINIGTSTFTGNGSGLTDLNASQITTGTVQGARLGGNQTMAGVKTFSDTTDASNTTSGAFRIGGGLGVAKKLYAASFHGDGSGITAINASNISSGTINDGRLPGTQTGKTFSSDITVNSHKVGRGGGNSATNLAIAGGQAISTGTDNMIIGVGAGAGIITGTDNVAVGNAALAAVTSVTHNTAIGNDSQAQRTGTGGYNTSVGAQSMSNSTAGGNNVAMGYQALELVTGSDNTAIGTNAGDTLTTGSSNILIGYNVQPTANTTSNEITIGTTTQTSLRIPGVNLTANTTTFTFSGTTGFSGVGTNLTALNASQLTSGTVPDGRIAATSVTQHQGSITGTGALNSGSITSGFGNIDIGTSNLTATGTVSLGATGFNGNNVSGILDLYVDDQIISTGDTNTYMQFHAADQWRVVTGGGERLEVNNTTTTVQNNLSVSGTITGDGASVTNLNATNLASGTVANARIDGTYSNLTGTGALDAGSITSNFGDINIGTSTFTGNGSGLTNISADTLDGIDSTSFLRSDVDDTATGLITFQKDGEVIKLVAPTTSNSPYMGFYQGTTRRAYIQFVNGGTLRLASDQHGSRLDIGNGTNGLTYTDGTTWTVWHSGNTGSGSGLDADTIDGIDSGSFIRSDADDTASGTYDYTSTSDDIIDFTGSSTSDNRGIAFNNRTALSADFDDGYLRLNNASEFTNGVYTPGNLRVDGVTYVDDTRGITNVTGQYGTIQTSGAGINNWEGYSIDGRIVLMHDGASNTYLYNDVDNEAHFLAVRNSYFRLYYNGSTRLTCNNTTVDVAASFTATGEVTAYSSDERLKTNIRPIENALDKVKQLQGVHYDWIDEVEELGFNPSIKVNDAGVLAQQVQKVLPQAVTYAPFDRKYDEQSGDDIGSKSGEDYLTVKYEKMVPLLIEAIKEQQEEIDQLKQMVKDLLNK